MTSLRLRLMAGAMVAVAIALALAWLAMTVIFDRHIERRLGDELRRQAVPLLAGLLVGSDGRPIIDSEPPDPRFLNPASGLYWQVSAPGGAARSRSLWDASLPNVERPPADSWAQRTGAGPFGQQLYIAVRTVRPTRTGPALTVQFAADLAQLNPARREFGREIALFLALLWAVLLVAAWVQVSLGLRPLRAIRAEMERLRGDPGARLAGGYPREVRPLIRAINALAEAREADLTRARRRAADLAHSLKTPLAALAAQSRRAREAGAVSAADGLNQAIAAVSAAVEVELARVRIGLVRSAGRSTGAMALVERLTNVVEHTEFGERIAFALDLPADFILPLAEEDAAEMIGPLIENAAFYAVRQVCIAGATIDGAICLSVADDGPGIDAARIDDAVLRGKRLDAAGFGHGLGLGIARDIAEATGAMLTLDASDLGGLKVLLRWEVAPA